MLKQFSSFVSLAAMQQAWAQEVLPLEGHEDLPSIEECQRAVNMLKSEYVSFAQLSGEVTGAVSNDLTNATQMWVLGMPVTLSTEEPTQWTDAQRSDATQYAEEYAQL